MRILIVPDFFKGSTAADGSAIWTATGSTLIKLQVTTATATQHTLQNALTYPR